MINFTQFESLTSATPGIDHIVGYYQDSTTGVKKEARWSIDTFVKNIVTTGGDTGTIAGNYQIRALADSYLNDYYSGAAITTNEEVVVWGYQDVPKVGHLWNTVSSNTRTPTVIPLLDGPDNSSLDSRRRLVNVRREGKYIVKLYMSYYMGMLLLSDGTVWVKSYLDPSYAHGWSTAEITGTTAKYASAFYRITNWDWANTAISNKIVDIQLLPHHSGNSDCTNFALDDSGDLHFWGYMNPMWGTSYTYNTPQNITKGHFALKQNVKEFQACGMNGNKLVRAITKSTGAQSNQLWGFGYNSHGQLGTNSTTAPVSWTRAKNAGGDVSNAFTFLEQRNYSYLNTGYISVSGASTNDLYVAGWEHDTYSLKSTTSTTNIYVIPTGGNSPIADPIVQACTTGRYNYISALYRTRTGKVFSAGTNSWGECGRMNGTSPYLGPTFAEVNALHPLTNAVIKFGPTSGYKAEKIITDESWGGNATAIIASNSVGFKYLFLAGYRTLANIDTFAQSVFVFWPVMLQDSVKDVKLYGDRDDHQYTHILCENRSVYGLGYSNYGCIQERDGWVSLPKLIF